MFFFFSFNANFGRIFRDIAAGLDHLHQNDVIHLDIKSANLLVRTEPVFQVKLLADFGTSRVMMNSLPL